MKLTIFFFGVFLLADVAANRTIYIVPIGGVEYAKKLFFDPYCSRDELARPFCVLREGLESLGYTVRFTDNAEGLDDVAGIIVLQEVTDRLLANLTRYDRHKCILFVYEPPVVMPHLHNFERFLKYFGKIFTFMDDRVDNKRYYKFYYAQPRFTTLDDVPDFHHKKFCVMINGNKNSPHASSLYNERRSAIRFFETHCPQEFDLYGPDWHGYPSWRGSVASKWDMLKRYKFCICYENMCNQVGYITEKIFDCFVAGCVPVYWGASNITDYIPGNCFIDRRRFNSHRELYSFLKNMDRATYEQYLAHISQYLKGPQAHLFSSEYFLQTIIQALGLRNRSQN